MHIKGRIKQKWGQLTDNDVAEIQGKRDVLEGKLRTKYGYSEQRARDEINEFEKENQ